jgi:putative endonuclease
MRHNRADCGRDPVWGDSMFIKKKTSAGVGQLGEALAAEYLRDRRYVIVETNYRRACGEVDIIARDRGALVFVEVKCRSSDRYGAPSEAVDARKQRQLSRIALEYLHARQLVDTPARFDVISVRLHPDNQQPTIEHIQNAFDFSL